MESTDVRTVAICDTEPVAIEGLQSVIKSLADLRMVGGETSLISGMELVRNSRPDLVVVDKGFGFHAVVDWTRRLRNSGTRPLVWSTSVNESEALRLVEAGALGVVRKGADIGTLLTAMRTVASGNTWMESSLAYDYDRRLRGPASNLTSREFQVLELVEQGMRNKDIAQMLGIQAGTVKIHLKHIFEKTGIHGRYGLALSGLKEKGYLSLPTM